VGSLVLTAVHESRCRRNYFNLEEGKKVRLFLRDEREEILDKYAGIIKLGRTVKLKEILTLGEDRWQ
jgi:predicted DNA-binding antitoxin AbrB/MazE fold protein